MMIEKSGTIRLKDIHIPQGGTPEQQELAQGMVRVNHLYRSALKVAVTQLEILDEEFASLYDHSPIHHIEYRIKTVDSIVEKLKRRGFEVTIDNIYAHIQDVAAGAGAAAGAASPAPTAGRRWAPRRSSFWLRRSARPSPR